LNDVWCEGLMNSWGGEIERLGVATAAEAGLETLIEGMRNEGLASSSVFVGHHQIGAWFQPTRAAEPLENGSRRGAARAADRRRRAG
jgi:hypothetical protein